MPTKKKKTVKKTKDFEVRLSPKVPESMSSKFDCLFTLESKAIASPWVYRQKFDILVAVYGYLSQIFAIQTLVASVLEESGDYKPSAKDRKFARNVKTSMDLVHKVLLERGQRHP
jgi:hypothetical protein